MGYNTYYRLEVVPETKLVTAIESEEILSEVFLYSGIAYEWNKWYEHEKDMLEISERHPDVEFILHGEGEERDDNWIKHFRNGYIKRRPGSIVYPRPDDVPWENE